jgi:Dolichyl-phosphate-mannose-protein mannosyltransferase
MKPRAQPCAGASLLPDAIVEAAEAAPFGRLPAASRSDRINAAACTSALLFPALLLAARLSTGISASPDSIAYLYAASRLLSDGGLMSFIGPPGTHLTIFAPLYPAVIALVNLAAPSLQCAAVIVSIAFMILTSGLTYLLFRELKVTSPVAALLTLIIFMHPNMQKVFWFAWSEGLYIGICLLILYALTRASGWTSGYAGLLIGLLVGFGFLTRYAGISLLPAALVGAASIQGWSIRKRLVCATFVLLAAASVISVWLARNYFVDRTLLGPRTVSEDTMLFAVKSVISTLGELLVPISQFEPFFGRIGAAGIIAVVAIVAARGKWPRPFTYLIAPALALVCCHTVLMVCAQISTLMDPIDSRLMSPVFVPAALVLAGVTISSQSTLAAAPLAQRAMRVTFGIAAAYLIVVSSLSVRWVGKEPSGFILDPIGIPAIPEPCRSGKWPTFSNGGYYLRFLGVVEDARPLPRQLPYRRTQRVDDWASFVHTVRNSDACLIWVGGESAETPPVEVILGGPAEGVTVTKFSSVRGMIVLIAGVRRHDSE